MKAVVLLCTVVLAIAPPAVADAQSTSAQPAAGCTGIVQSVNSLAATIAGNANSYWAYRANFVELAYGPSNVAAASAAASAAPNTAQAADQEKSQAVSLKAAIPNNLASFKASVASAQTQNCLPAAQLSAIVEPTIKLAKRVNFDQFPPDENLEEPSGPTAPRMPTN